MSSGSGVSSTWELWYLNWDELCDLLWRALRMDLLGKPSTFSADGTVKPVVGEEGLGGSLVSITEALPMGEEEEEEGGGRRQRKMADADVQCVCAQRLDHRPIPRLVDVNALNTGRSQDQRHTR